MRVLLLLCIAAVTLTGCAGIIAPFIKNKYAGTYDGTFTTSDGKTGTATIQLTNIGNIFGTLTDTASGASGTLTGSVNTSLSYSGTVSFRGDTHAVSGKLSSNNGRVAGNLTGSGGYTCTIDILNRVGTGGTTSTTGTTGSSTTTTGSSGGGTGTTGNPYAGSFKSSNGDTAMITSDGVLAASIADPTAGTDTFNGTITSAGAFTATGTNSIVSNVPVTASGQATLASGTLTVSIAVTYSGKTTNGTETFTKQ